ncbi:toll/interleukin-1 receptor domain-containing protein [Gimesia maris]|uniref:toll/interleukin-1 receptor domain-containing protein n=1 Tax=Gimesia maris TaxID=122 RepID=UPI0032EC8801
MANPKHVEIVKQGAEAISEWRSENSSGILDLRGADFSGITLLRANFSEANLKGASFRKAFLVHVQFNNADLQRSDFQEAELYNTDFSGAGLYNANLSNSRVIDAIMNHTYLAHANLRFVDLGGTLCYWADFSDADLSFTKLHNTIFTGAILDRANLHEAETIEPIWSDVDLSSVKGLTTIKHGGPCTIGINTLVNSKGKLPEVFLRGCGLSDEFISYVPSHFSGSAIDFYSCFISYSHEDKSFARRLHDALQGRGIRCWLDEHQILPGDNIYERIDHGIRVWDKVLLCASRHSLTSGWVDDELKHAFAKEKQLFKDRGCEVLSLIPLNLDGYLFSDWNHPKKNQVLERMAPDFTGWESDNAKFEQQLERVVKALQTKNTAREPEPKPKL